MIAPNGEAEIAHDLGGDVFGCGHAPFGVVICPRSLAPCDRVRRNDCRRGIPTALFPAMRLHILVVSALCVALGHVALSQSVAAEESAIRAARARSNRAIAAHDLDAAAAIWTESYVGVSSGNARSIGRDEERTQFAQLIASRPGVVYVRTPNTVTVNTSWAQAGESGRWTGSWSSAEGMTRVGGIYFAKWVKANGEWRIVAETFVQTSCGGTHYCDAPPP